MQTRSAPHPLHHRHAIYAAFLWLVIYLAGEINIGSAASLMSNKRCFSLIGCNSGFFGYDALEHFLAGIMISLFLLRLSSLYPRFSVLSDGALKRTMGLVAVVSFLTFGWEFVELLIDIVRVHLWREQALQTLWQSSNADTMGDMTLAIFGSLLAGVIYVAWLARRRSLGSASNVYTGFMNS